MEYAYGDNSLWLLFWLLPTPLCYYWVAMPSTIYTLLTPLFWLDVTVLSTPVPVAELSEACRFGSCVDGNSILLVAGYRFIFKDEELLLFARGGILIAPFFTNLGLVLIDVSIENYSRKLEYYKQFLICL